MISILTGDIVGSQSLDPTKRAQIPACLKDAADYVDLGKSLEVFGGDRWQTFSELPENTVAQALVFSAYLFGVHQIETRISIGIGRVESLHLEKISLSQGEAFVLSGRGLEEMDDERRITVHPSESLPHANRSLLQAAVTLLDGLSSKWTSKQAQAVALDSHSVLPFLAEQNKKDLAKKFSPPISAQAFGKHLASAQWKLVTQALQMTASGIQQTPFPLKD